MKSKRTGIDIIEQTILSVGGRLLWASQVEGVSSRIYGYQIGSQIVLMQTFIRDGQEDGYMLYGPTTTSNLISDDIAYIGSLAKSSR